MEFVDVDSSVAVLDVVDVDLALVVMLVVVEDDDEAAALDW